MHVRSAPPVEQAALQRQRRFQHGLHTDALIPGRGVWKGNAFMGVLGGFGGWEAFGTEFLRLPVREPSLVSLQAGCTSCLRATIVTSSVVYAFSCVFAPARLSRAHVIAASREIAVADVHLLDPVLFPEPNRASPAFSQCHDAVQPQQSGGSLNGIVHCALILPAKAILN